MPKGYGTAVFEWLLDDHLTEFRMNLTFELSNLLTLVSSHHDGGAAH
jgi:hypothetical protein